MFERFAVYYTATGALGAAGAAWLGWDIETGSPVPHPRLDPPLDLAALTQTPRRYGFHATIKPPFHLAAGQSPLALQETFAAFCDAAAPVRTEGLEVTRLGRFIALTLRGEQSALGALAASAVRDLDAFRAPPSEAELERRRRARLTPQQEDNLARWGYPHVMEAFRFHMTLSGRTDQADALLPQVHAHFDPLLRKPLSIDALSLVGQDEAGMFHLIDRRPLGAGPRR